MNKLLTIVCLIIAAQLPAQETTNDLSQQAANPIADLMSFPFQNNLNIKMGPTDRSMNILNIQPVLPFTGGKLITRTIFPIVWIPDYTSESGLYSSGLSDIIFSAFYVPAGQPFMWGIGPVVEIPTGGEKRGSQKWSLGPSVVALVQPGDWTFGVLANNTWSIAGKSERANVNHMLVNLFIVRQLDEGWYVNSAPIITADWTAEDDNWIVPLGIGGGKLVFLGGKLPLNIQSQIYYNIVHPDFGPAWQWRFQIQILLPKNIIAGKK